MSKNVRLSDLLMQTPPDMKKLAAYSRSKKIFDNVDLGQLAVVYQGMKKTHSPQVTPLHVACYACTKPDVVNTLVKEGWSVNNDLKNIGSPLGIALEGGNISIAKLLIELGADAKSFYQEGITPMFLALSTREKKEKTAVAAVKLLLEAGVSVNAVVNSESGERAIHIAVADECVSVVRFLLRNGADLNVQDKEGYTPIHIAVCNNHLDIVKLLLLHGADLYLENHVRDTPLLIAVKNDFKEIVKELVRGGCDVNRLCSSNSNSAIHAAVVVRGPLEMVKLLVSLGGNPMLTLPNGSTPLHVLATRNFTDGFFSDKENQQERKEVAEYLLDNGTNLNVHDKNMKTPLQLAVETGLLSLAKVFIKYGADFNYRKSDGNTVLHEVVPYNRDITILLLEFGADYQVYNKKRLTPYHLAISNRVDLKYMKCFLKHGCPYDQNLPVWTNLVRNFKKEERFFAAEKKFFKGIRENNVELVKRSVKEGAVPTSCCEDMKYPLHFVALHGYKDVLTFLLEENAQPNTLNEKGQTPLYLAASMGHYDICYILLRFGACYNYISEKCPKTPRMVASELKHVSVVSLFDRVRDIFRKAKSRKDHVVKFLESIRENDFDYQMFRSVINRKGNTILSTALQYKQYHNTRKMLEMKLQHHLRS